MTFWVLVLGLLAGWFAGEWRAGGRGFWRGVGFELLRFPFTTMAWAWGVTWLFVISVPAGQAWWICVPVLGGLTLMTAALRAAWTKETDDL